MSKQLIAAGFDMLWYGVIDSSGYFTGGIATAPTAGNATGAPMLRLWGARTLPISIGESNIVTVLGDNQPMVSFEFDPDTLPAGVFEMAVSDTIFDALIEGTLTRTLGTDLDLNVIDPQDRDPVTMCLLATRQAKSWKSGERGVLRWESIFINKCTIKPLYTDLTQREFGPYRYSINMSRSDIAGWESIHSGNYGTSGGSAIKIGSHNPIMLERHTGNNAQTAFNLTYTPVSQARTYCFVNWAATAITLAGKTITFAAAPATDAVIATLYETTKAELT